MRIGVSLVEFRHGFGGAGAYLRRVLTTIHRVQPEVDLVLFTDAMSSPLFGGWEQILVGKFGPDAPYPVESSLERAIRRAQVERLFTSLENAPAKSGVPHVLHALDLHFLEESAGKRHRFGGDPLKEFKRLGHEAAGVVVPSEALRQRLLALLNVPINQVVVALPGAMGGNVAYPAPFVERPYLLAVVDTHAQSNLAQLLEAFKRIQHDGPYNLVVVGEPGECEPSDWGPCVLRIDECPAAQMAGLFAYCDACVCPSSLETDSIIVLDSMRAGARIVAPRVGGVPELAASAPVYFEPESTTSLVAAIRRVLTEPPAERARYIKFGQQRAAEFTWEQCAWKVLSAFRRTT